MFGLLSKESGSYLVKRPSNVYFFKHCCTFFLFSLKEPLYRIKNMALKYGKCKEILIWSSRLIGNINLQLESKSKINNHAFLKTIKSQIRLDCLFHGLWKLTYILILNRKFHCTVHRSQFMSCLVTFVLSWWCCKLRKSIRYNC